MPRQLEGSTRKHTYGVSLRDEEHDALVQIGGGSLSKGLAWLMDTVLERDPERPEFRRVAEVRAAFEKHQQELHDQKAADAAARLELAEEMKRIKAEQKAVAAAERERARAAKKAAKGPSKAEQELALAVEHFDGLNAQRFAKGQPLYDMSHMSRNPVLVTTVYANARAKYGWEKGPRPPGLVSPAGQNPPTVQKNRGENTPPEPVFDSEPPRELEELQKSNTVAAPGENSPPVVDELQVTATTEHPTEADTLATPGLHPGEPGADWPGETPPPAATPWVDPEETLHRSPLYQDEPRPDLAESGKGGVDIEEPQF